MLEDMDEEKVMKFFRDQGLTDKDNSTSISQKEEEEKLISELECENSFYLFSKVLYRS